MNQSKLYKKIIVGLSIGASLLFSVIYFVYSDIREKNGKISLIEQELLSQNNKYDHSISMQKLVKSIEPDIRKINSSIIPKSGDVDFIEELESVAKGHNLSIKIDSLSLVSDTKIASSSVNTLKIKANAEGTWSNVYIFLSELESLPYKIKINRFTIVNSDDLALDGTRVVNQGNKWQVTFEISVLEYK